MMKLQAKYAQPESSATVKREECVGDRYMEPQLSLPFKWRDQKRSTRSVVFLHSEQHTKEEKPYHMLRTSIIVGRLYWPNSSTELLIWKRQKFRPTLVCPSLGLMHSYVCMWRLCTLRGKLFRFRWNCSINSQWKEVRRIRRGESFHSSQVRVTYTHVFRTPRSYVNTHKKDKLIKKPYIFFQFNKEAEEEKWNETQFKPCVLIRARSSWKSEKRPHPDTP